MPTLWAQTTEFASISIGDDLPILVKFDFRPPVQPGTEAPAESPVDADKLTAYVKELLFKGFPADSVNNEETTIETESLIDFLPGDTISVCGRVAGKLEQEGRRLVECAVTVESEEGVVLATAKAVISL